MTVNERVKYLRKDVLKLSQTEFAIKLGMKQTGVSGFEQVGATMTDQTIKTICLVFNVNEEWIRYGTDPMFVESDAFSLDDFVKSHNGTEIELEILKAYFELDPDIRKRLIEHFRSRFMDRRHPETPEELEQKYPPVKNDTQAG